eukprot:5474760-Alexandrium_andersonii.AAC.1
MAAAGGTWPRAGPAPVHRPSPPPPSSASTSSMAPLGPRCQGIDVRRESPGSHSCQGPEPWPS